jgi:hypothetical protein
LAFSRGMDTPKARGSLGGCVFRFLLSSGAGMDGLTGICAVTPPPEIGVLTPGINTSRRTGILVVFDESLWAKAMEPYRLTDIKNMMARIAKRTFVE